MTESATSPTEPPSVFSARGRTDAGLSPRRLLDLQQAASYLGVSCAQTRELIVHGYLPHVRLPCPRANDGRAMRKILIDQDDLDRFINRHKEGGTL